MLVLAAGAIFSLVVGLALEPLWGWIALSAVLAVQVLYHLRRIALLGRWLEHGETPEPPRARGAWDGLHAVLHRSRRESARREAQLAHAVERWRQAARALPDGVVILEGEIDIYSAPE